MSKIERTIPDRASVAPDTPLRLDVAAALAFPGGTTTVAALRREIAAGRLVAWLVGGRHLTSLAEIERMLDRCRVKPKARDCGSENPGKRKGSDRPKPAAGSSSTEQEKTELNIAQAAALATVEALKERLRTTSRRSTRRTTSPDGNVVSLKSRSPTC